jgi:hypothetical protein
VHNFNAGPAALPLPVLEQVQRDLLDFAGSGMSILELTHRSAMYEEVHNQAIADLRTLLRGSEEYAILFMGGGAQTQFALVPMNLSPARAHADYLITGPWSMTALQEAQKLGDATLTAFRPLRLLTSSILKLLTFITPATTPSWARSTPSYLRLAMCLWCATCLRTFLAVQWRSHVSDLSMLAPRKTPALQG